VVSESAPSVYARLVELPRELEHTMPNQECDVLVVGCGVAGLTAALSAVQQGARTVVIERAPQSERGGNTRYTTAALRMRSETEVAPDFETEFAANAGYHLDPAMVAETAADYANWPAIVKTMNMTDPELISVFAQRAPATIAWLKEHGVRYAEMPYYGLTARSSPRIGISGGGYALIEALCPEIEARGGQFLYQTTARSLALDEHADAIDTTASDGGGLKVTIRASSVVLASGGFQGNPEMVARYIGPTGRYLRPIARGGYYNKGEGIEMALALGAAPAGDYSDYHSQPIDPRSGKTEPLVMIFTQGILVNRNGRRFVDEAPGSIDAHYERICRIIAGQPGGIAYCILDSKVDDIENWQRCVRSDQAPVEASSLVELAARLDIPCAAFSNAVASYNAACTGDGFDPFIVDGQATAGIEPHKSNWARPLDQPPFKAYPVTASNTFTFGGLKVDPHARVLNTDGKPIRGLYAAGETLGLYYNRYPGATSVLRGAVFGKLAGAHAANRKHS
jgi:tricarballylate dehydrogenase